MGRAEHKSIDSPDETHTFEKGRVDLVTVGLVRFGRAVLEPGWRWSRCVGRIAGSDRCDVHHNGYVVSGRLRIEMNDGSHAEVGPGDVFAAPPGHDESVVGDEPCVLLDFASTVATYVIPLAPHLPASESDYARRFAHATANAPMTPSNP